MKASAKCNLRSRHGQHISAALILCLKTIQLLFEDNLILLFEGMEQELGRVGGGDKNHETGFLPL